MDDLEFESQLCNLGLSSKAAMVYREILSEGQLSVTDLASEADISKAYAYDVAESLADEGLIEFNDHFRPTTVRARPADEAMSSFRERLLSVRGEIDRRYSASDRDKPIEVIKSRQTLIRRMKELLRTATHEAMIAVPPQVFSDLRPALQDAINNDVLVLILLTDYDEEFDTIPSKAFEGTASVVRTTDATIPIFLGLRKESVLFAPVGMLNGDGGDFVAVVHTVKYLIDHLPTFLEDYWSMGEERYVTEEVSLPVTYSQDDFRQACLQATLHLERGTDLVVEASAKPAEGPDKYEQIGGRVLDTRQRLALTDNEDPYMHLAVEAKDGLLRLAASTGGNSTHVIDEVTLSSGDGE